MVGFAVEFTARFERWIRNQSISSLQRRKVPQISCSPFKLACPSRPIMMWSCTSMPSGLAVWMIVFVISIFAHDEAGIGSSHALLQGALALK
jgi:hypothetical protein